MDSTIRIGLVGYDELAKTFARIADGGLLTHAYCLTGDRGIGKATFAWSFAAYLERGSFDPDGAALMDVTTISPGESGAIGIEAVRDIRRFLWQTPFRSPRRTAVIDGAEALTAEAQGALLKIMEEPPAHTLLILITDRPGLLTPPLRSRMSVVHVPRIPAPRVERFLAEVRGLPPADAARIARRSFGSIGLALSLAAPREPRGGDGGDVGDEIEKALVAAHEGGFRGFSPGILAWLAARLELVRRHNVNPGLQRRAAAERGVRYTE